MHRYIFSILALITLAHSASAELTWTKDEGWSSQTGLAGLLWTDTSDAQTGVDAMNKATEYQQEGEYNKALAFYKKVYEQYTYSELAPEAIFQTAVIRTDRHQYADAFQLYERIIENYPDYPKFDAVIRKQFEVATLLMEGNRPYYWGIIPGFKDYDSAIEYFEGVIENAPYADLAPQALMNIALISKEHGKPDETIDALDRLVAHYSKNPLAEKAYLMLAESHFELVYGPAYDQGSTREALNYYEDFLSLYPNSEYVREAETGKERCLEMLSKSKLILGDFYYQYRNKGDAALVFYNEAITVSPNTASAEKAEEQIEKIKNGVEPPKSPADVIFGRYNDTHAEPAEEPI